jgi:hypothetical protein
VIDWYKVAESKAQLILTVNGAFVTITFGLLSGSVAELRRSVAVIGILTWFFLTLALVALCGSIVAAALSLVAVLTYNVHGLARTVLRKHRLINTGWLLTSASLLSLVGAGASLLLHG